MPSQGEHGISDQDQGEGEGRPGDVQVFKRNLGLYKDIGGNVWIQGREEKWKEQGVDVFLTNWYFVEDPTFPDGGASAVSIGPPVEAAFHNTRNNVHKHFAIGIGGKVTFNGVLPSMGPVSLPIIGVISKAEVVVRGEPRTFVTQKGSVPSNFPV